jgi:diguanylate cyclase (GGDEF)-like protein
LRTYEFWDPIPTEERAVVISLKKYLDMDNEKPASAVPKPADLLSTAINSYRAALLAMGTSSVRACPMVGIELQKRLAELEGELSGSVTPELIASTGKKVEEQLGQWGESSEEYLKQKACDVKELLLALARTAQSVGDRDNKYADQLSQFTARLHGIANLEDLTQIRASLVSGALELKSYVDRMTEDSQSLVKQLKTEVSDYETKLKAAEELVIRDVLTGLSNRRNVEERIELRISKGHPFCVAILDMDRFKLVNDSYGHQAGDSLLKQFATELRTNSRGHDTVGRWGGDEFILVLDCDLAAANLQIDRTRKWMFGEYKVLPAGAAAEIKIQVSASIGLAEWTKGESLDDVIEHADSAMYLEKGLKRGIKR